jgi:hypothetical protein
MMFYQRFLVLLKTLYGQSVVKNTDAKLIFGHDEEVSQHYHEIWACEVPPCCTSEMTQADGE